MFYIYIYTHTHIHIRNYHALKMFVNSLAHDADFLNFRTKFLLTYYSFCFFPLLYWMVSTWLFMYSPEINSKREDRKILSSSWLTISACPTGKEWFEFRVNHTHVYMRLMSPCNIQELKMRKREISKGELNFCCVVLKRIIPYSFLTQSYIRSLLIWIYFSSGCY